MRVENARRLTAVGPYDPTAIPVRFQSQFRLEWLAEHWVFDVRHGNFDGFPPRHACYMVMVDADLPPDVREALYVHHALEARRQLYRLARHCRHNWFQVID